MTHSTRTKAGTALLVLAAAFPLACSDAAAPRSADRVAVADAPIRTDRAEYVAARSGGGVSLDIQIRYTNPTAGATWLSTCHGANPPVLEKLVGDSWVLAYDPPVPLCLGAPIVVRPGASFDDTFPVRAAPRGTNRYPQFEVEPVAGTYRLVWDVYQGDGSELRRNEAPMLLPIEQRVSNTFRIIEP